MQPVRITVTRRSVFGIDCGGGAPRSRKAIPGSKQAQETGCPVRPTCKQHHTKRCEPRSTRPLQDGKQARWNLKAGRLLGVTGQRLSQAGWLSPSVPNRKEAASEAGFTSSSGGVRAPSVTRSRNCAVRSDEKPLQVESSSPGRFRAWANRSYPEGIRLLLCISTGGRLWRLSEEGQPNERR
jgi:hypothetical protein